MALEIRALYSADLDFVRVIKKNGDSSLVFLCFLFYIQFHSGRPTHWHVFLLQRGLPVTSMLFLLLRIAEVIMSLICFLIVLHDKLIHEYLLYRFTYFFPKWRPGTMFFISYIRIAVKRNTPEMISPIEYSTMKNLSRPTLFSQYILFSLIYIIIIYAYIIWQN